MDFAIWIPQTAVYILSQKTISIFCQKTIPKQGMYFFIVSQLGFRCEIGGSMLWRAYFTDANHCFLCSLSYLAFAVAAEAVFNKPLNAINVYEQNEMVICEVYYLKSPISRFSEKPSAPIELRNNPTFIKRYERASKTHPLSLKSTCASFPSGFRANYNHFLRPP